jgi:DNA-binding MarR family transcriptional regulator
MSSTRFARIPMWAASADISQRALRVLIAIAGHLDRTGWAWPSLTTIAEMTGIDRRHVLRAIAELETAGLIYRDRATDGGRGKSTRYRVIFDKQETGAKSAPVVSTNRGQNSPSLRPKTGAVLDKKQGPNRPPEHIEQKEQTLSARACESFMKFKGAYPSRGDHGDPEKPAQKEFEAALERGVEAEEIIAGAERYAAQVARTGIEPRFVKMAVNWLRNESWNDRARPPERRRLVAGMN